LAKISFSNRVLKWFDQNGRKDLPWQQNINPYRVWVSEIMLQQTQVKTVIPYFEKFMSQLPNIKALAEAEEDLVLHLWTGLGYYSRARNLHKTAQIICKDYAGSFPDSVDQLSDLPGIGRSTAGAITSIAFQKPAAILDGNVKRVLARHNSIPGWPGQSAVLKTLWQQAERYTPTKRVAAYSQAMMDLGATVCTRTKPACGLCPLSNSCQAYKQGNATDFPGKKPKKTMPIKTTQMLIIENPRGEILLEKRPSSGIWGSLWCFPMASDEKMTATIFNQLNLHIDNRENWQSYRHTFSHYHLDISPVRVKLSKDVSQVMEANQQLWYNLRQPQTIGLSAPVKKLLGMLDTL
jgi:A/G-specific adenine glycosylase